jgi:transketolase
MDNMDYIQGAEYHGSLKAPYDRFFISPAHYAAPVYAALIEADRLDEAALEMFNRDGYSMEMIGANHTPGFENAAGTLDQAISVAGGTAHARKLRDEEGRVFVMMSDGEMEEGQLWEAIQAAVFYQLDNLVLIVDINGQQVEGETKKVMNIEPLEDRFTAFGAKAISVNGHDIEAIEEAAKQGEKNKPLVILCYTDPTQGIPYLNERRPILHFVRLKEGEEFDKYTKFYNEM